MQADPAGGRKFSVSVIAELHLAIFDIQQAMVGNGNAVSIASHVVEYLLGSSKGWFGIVLVRAVR